MQKLTLPLVLWTLACSATPGDRTVETPPQLDLYPGAPFEDRDGRLWFSTVGGGLVRFDGKSFRVFTRSDGLASDVLRGIAEDEDGTLWIATTEGVSLFDGESFRTLTDYGDIPFTRSFYGHGDHRDVWDVFQDDGGTWWIATVAGVFRHDGERFVPFELPAVAAPGASEFGPRMVYDIDRDRDGALWFCTDGAGAIRYDDDGFTRYTAEEHGLASDRVCTVLQDARGDHWFGTSDGGVARFDGATFTTWLRSDVFSKHTGWGRYLAIHEDREGSVWFGVSAAGGGVYRYDGTSFQRFSGEHGLGDGGVPSIREDRSGHLWLGTTKGVYRWDGAGFVRFGRR